MPRPAVSLVAIVARDGGIGLRGGLLVHLPDDLRRFKALTLGHPVVMGRKTWQAIGRALPGRRSIVVTRFPKPDRNARCTKNQTIQPGIPLSRRRPTLATARKRPIVATDPRSR